MKEKYYDQNTPQPQDGSVEEAYLICPYCGRKAPWVPNELRYGKRYGKSYMCYWCKNCDAYVGCHNNTTQPLGTMANRDLTVWRQRAHAAIDPFWKEGPYSRAAMYSKLKHLLGRQIHVGESDIEQCKSIIYAAQFL